MRHLTRQHELESLSKTRQFDRIASRLNHTTTNSPDTDSWHTTHKTHSNLEARDDVHKAAAVEHALLGAADLGLGLLHLVDLGCLVAHLTGAGQRSVDCIRGKDTEKMSRVSMRADRSRVSCARQPTKRLGMSHNREHGIHTHAHIRQ